MLQIVGKSRAGVALALVVLIGVVAIGQTSSDASHTAGGSAHFWTAVGSTGVVDEADVNEVTFSTATAGIRSSVPSGSVVLRYNVTAVDDVFLSTSGSFGTSLDVLFRDTGTNGRAIVRLRRINANTGGSSTLLTLDSNNFAAQAGFQRQKVDSCSQLTNEFANNAYVVDVTLSRTSGTVSPDVLELRLNRFLCAG